MSSRSTLVLLSLACLSFVAAGCGGGGSAQSGGSGTGPGAGPGPGPGTGGVQSTPLLLGVEPDPLLITTGDVVTIRGINFSNDLAGNVVNFTSASQRIPGIPIFVNFPTDGNPNNGLESELQVVVPGGISSGNVELRVDGIDAGARGYDARPQIMAWTLGRNETQEFLEYQPLLGFLAQASFVKVFGLNFNEIEAVELEDSQGGSQTISPNAIERNPAPPPGSPPNSTPTGYSVIGFNLKDSRNDVRLNFVAGQRQNLKVRIKSPSGLSNAVEVPVFTDPNPQRLGAVINSVKVPTAVRTGQVRLNFTMYDRALSQGIGSDANYDIEVLWKLVNEEDSLYRRATPSQDDPEQSGAIKPSGANLVVSGLVPGFIGHTSQHRLFPGGGSFFTYTWDAPNDPGLRTLSNTPVNGKLPPRYMAIQFLVRPVVGSGIPSNVKVSTNNHAVITPSILYYTLGDRTGEDVSSERFGSIVEAFETDVNEDTRLNTADYGPPSNPGALIGHTGGTVPDQFGKGTAALELLNAAPEDLQPDAVSQYYVINTDDMTIVYRQISSDNGTPCELDDDELAGGGKGQRFEVFDNPGAALKEFHIQSLIIGPGVTVFARGDNPLIIRAQGKLDLPSEEVITVGAGSKLDLSGCPGEDGPRPNASLDTPGRGGKPGPGGGVGGDGATMGQVGQTIQVTHAMRGERDGGYGGETTGGVDSTDLVKGSKVPGGPGGGGGNRTPGFAGDSGAPAPPRFAPPRAGKGGPPRGESRLMLLSPGSGGGGGGSSLGVTNNVGAANAGAGGGGGGGALKIVASGKIVVEDSASIVAMGGSGGAGVKPAAPPGTEGISFGSPGGGGSGGCILLEAQGTVDVSCESLLASGGTGGTSQAKQNLLPGSGTGGEGWIRVESAAGGVPTCAALSAESQLTAEVSVKEVAAMQVTDTGTFPSSGTVIVQDTGTGATLEEIMYLSKTPTSLNSLFRAATPVKLPSGSRVVLKGNIVPYNTPVLSGGGIVPASGTIDLGRGRDGEVHLAFEPSVDLATGQPLLDEETGAPISRWVFDTDASVLRRPSGAVVFEAASSDTAPGRLECSRLLIEPNTVLRGVGSHPLEIVVTGQAEIAGQIDVSGFDGGVLQFSTDSSTNPQPGTGGPGGPGGGSGGPGGVVNFADGNLNNKDPANTIPVHGGAGLAPRDTPAGWDRTPVQYGPVNPEDDPVPPGSFTRATGGATIRGQGCENVGVCIQSAGGGGGGGNLEEGKDGNAFPEPRTYPGAGGSIFGIADFRFDGTYWFLGGTGGAGGGGNPHVSGTYQQGYGTSAQFNFRNSALHAPGTGGGGGGGGLRLAAQNLTLRSTARIRARGGDAVQSIDLGGNGGGGAGGVVLIQVTNALSFEPGSFIDVSGGLANRPVPILPGEDRVEYPGNEHPAGNTVEINGGVGGDGAAGRIRIEAAAGSAASQTGVNPSLSAGPFLLDTQLSTGVSKTLRIGVGPGLAASSHSIMIDASQITYFEFGLPNGTDSAVLWQAARESLDQHGGAEAFSTLPGSQGILGIQDSRSLRDHEFVRFVVPFLSNSQTKEAQAIQLIELPFDLSLPAP